MTATRPTYAYCRGWSCATVAKPVESLLAADIAAIKPRNLCILGSVAHVAASIVLPLPEPSPRFRYGRGWNGEVNGMNVIITAFANRRGNRAVGTENRACVVEALRRWV